MFQKQATPISAIASTMRFGAASVAARSAIGIAANFSRSTFEPRSLGTAKATRIAARKTANRPRSRRARGTRAVTRIPSTANATPGTKSATENGNWPPLGKMRRRSSSTMPAAATTATVARRGRRSSELPARISASSRNASGLASSVRKTSPAKMRVRPCCSALIAEQGERCAECEREGGREGDARPQHGEGAAREAGRLPPLSPDDECERQRGGADRGDRQDLDPDHGGQRVVDEAVGDERVAAAVPEVVPEGEPVLEEEGPLVGVRCEVDARRPEPDDEGRQGRGDCR